MQPLDCNEMRLVKTTIGFELDTNCRRLPSRLLSLKVHQGKIVLQFLLPLPYHDCYPNHDTVPDQDFGRTKACEHHHIDDQEIFLLVHQFYSDSESEIYHNSARELVLLFS